MALGYLEACVIGTRDAKRGPLRIVCPAAHIIEPLRNDDLASPLRSRLPAPVLEKTRNRGQHVGNAAPDVGLAVSTAMGGLFGAQNELLLSV